MRRGDIVLAQFPFAGSPATKNRPCLVVQADFYNQRLTNVLVATITTNLSRRHDPAHFFIDLSTANGRNSGLHQDSLVSCLNLAVLPKSDLATKFGELSDQTMKRIDECLKAALGIP